MKTTTDEQGADAAVAKLRELTHGIEVAMVTTVTPDGALRSRPMATLEVDDRGDLWFFTADDSGKAHDIADEHAVNVTYAAPRERRYVSASGNASVLHDREKARQMWRSALKAYFPRGLDEPHLALLHVRVESAEYWDSPSSQAVSLHAGPKAHRAPETAADDEHGKLDIRSARASG